VAKANDGLEHAGVWLFMVPGMNHCSGGIGASNFGGWASRFAQSRCGARSADRAGELGRTWCRTGAVHRHEMRGCPAPSENSAVHAADLPASGRGPLQGCGRPTTRRTSRTFVRNRTMAQLARPQRRGRVRCPTGPLACRRYDRGSLLEMSQSASSKWPSTARSAVARDVRRRKVRRMG
jgi:hypothetical protein